MNTIDNCANYRITENYSATNNILSFLDDLAFPFLLKFHYYCLTYSYTIRKYIQLQFFAYRNAVEFVLGLEVSSKWLEFGTQIQLEIVLPI